MRNIARGLAAIAVAVAALGAAPAEAAQPSPKCKVLAVETSTHVYPGMPAGADYPASRTVELTVTTTTKRCRGTVTTETSETRRYL